MSRHTISANEPQKFIVVVGHDKLGYYFGQVYDREKLDTDNELMFDVETHSIDILQRALAAYVTIPTRVRQALMSEMLSPTGSGQKIVNHTRPLQHGDQS